MTGGLANPEYVARQYGDGRRLAARHRLHADYTVTDAPPFLRWLFDLEAPAPGERLLEVGCGRGDLWLMNADRLPAAKVTATDASPGMAAEARARLASQPISVALADVGALPFPAEAFDVVLANHMLYHVADLAAGLAELHRVLRPGGTLHASTNGAGHMAELAAMSDSGPTPLSFTLENASGLLAPYFARPEVVRYPATLRITEAAPAVDYVASYRDLGEAGRSALERRIAAHIAAHGCLEVRKSVGLVSARRPV